MPGTLAALEALENAGYLSGEDAEFFAESYRFQRAVEAMGPEMGFAVCIDRMTDVTNEARGDSCTS